MAEQQQHVEFFRKVLLRQRLLRLASDGAAYVPFIGDGDLAVQLYADRMVFGADLDDNRVATAAFRLPKAELRTADCDLWPFPGLDEPFAVADFDAYAYPYHSFRSFWEVATPADRLALFFTDGQGLNIAFKGRWTDPNGDITVAPGFEQGKAAGDLRIRRSTWAFWFAKHVYPWFLGVIEPEWKVLDKFRYTRGSSMLYWGVVIERT